MHSDDETDLRERKAIGELIRSLRDARKLPLRHIAEGADVSISMLHHVESTGQNVSLDKLQRILRQLGARLTVVVEPSEAAPRDPLRAGLLEDLVAVIDVVPDEELQILSQHVRLWRRRYLRDESPK
jgi:transcriptional regulator with XRE-family HTH domain